MYTILTINEVKSMATPIKEPIMSLNYHLNCRVGGKVGRVESSIWEIVYKIEHVSHVECELHREQVKITQLWY